MTTNSRFPAVSRFLHWSMAIMIAAMLLIGVHMVTSVSDYRLFVSIHKPLGLAILLLAGLRLMNRFINPPPALPEAMPGWQKAAAHGSHILLYGLMIALPLVGWAMLSAQPYPVELFGAWHLPPLLSPDAALYASLRRAHTVLAYLLFFTVLVHLAAALAHAWLFRDGVFESMACPGKKPSPSDEA